MDVKVSMVLRFVCYLRVYSLGSIEFLAVLQLRSESKQDVIMHNQALNLVAQCEQLSEVCTQMLQSCYFRKRRK
jgi:hypothetical protein